MGVPEQAGEPLRPLRFTTGEGGTAARRFRLGRRGVAGSPPDEVRVGGGRFGTFAGAVRAVRSGHEPGLPTRKENTMWVPKWKRDQAKGVDSPVPTQVVSNEEFIPRPQNERQKRVEALIGELAEERSKKLGMDRRAYLASSMGLAAAFLAQNMVYGNYWDVDECETLEPAAAEEKWPKGEYFIIDVQAHFTN